MQQFRNCNNLPEEGTVIIYQRKELQQSTRGRNCNNLPEEETATIYLRKELQQSTGGRNYQNLGTARI
jgi:hypothetical protein